MSSDFFDIFADLSDAKEQELKRLQRFYDITRKFQGDRTLQIEEILSRMCLLLKSLTEVCIAKGVFTRDVLEAMIDQIDAGDGVRDGKLDPRELFPNCETVDPDSPGEFLRKLEQQSRSGPVE